MRLDGESDAGKVVFSTPCNALCHKGGTRLIATRQIYVGL